MKTRKVIIGCIISVLALVICQLLSQLIGIGLSFIHIPDALICSAVGLLYPITLYVLLKTFLKKCFNMPLAELGITSFRVKFKWLLAAMLLPCIVTVIYLFIPGHLEINHDIPLIYTVCTGIFVRGIGAGFAEEMVFRGVVLNLCLKKWGKAVAIIIPSVLFGAVHLIGMTSSLVNVMLVLAAGTMVGIMFSLIAIESGSIWSSGVIHAVWNIVIIGDIFNVSSTGEYSIFTYVIDSNSVILTGGDFGIESSIIATIAYMIISIYALSGIHKNQA